MTAADLLLDWRLALSMPVSLFRYPLAWSLKSPKVIVPFFSFVWGLEQLPGLVPLGAVDAASGVYVPTVRVFIVFGGGVHLYIFFFFFRIQCMQLRYVSVSFPALPDGRGDSRQRLIHGAGRVGDRVPLEVVSEGAS